MTTHGPETPSATRTAVSTLAAIIAAAGVMHGWFELLQGQGGPPGLVFNAIGPEQRLWEYAGLHAFTLLPSYAATGAAAVAVGTVATIWAVAGIGGRPGPWVMLGLFIALFLVGGGFGPLGVGIPVSLVATRIGKPPTRWPARLPAGPRTALAGAWPWTLVLYVPLFAASVATTVFGRPLTWLADDATAQAIVLQAGYVLLAVMALTLMSALCRDTVTAGRPGGPGSGEGRVTSRPATLR